MEDLELLKETHWTQKAAMCNLITNQIREQLKPSCTYCSFVTRGGTLFIKVLLKNNLNGKDEVMTELAGEPNYSVIEQVVSNIKAGLDGQEG